MEPSQKIITNDVIDKLKANKFMSFFFLPMGRILRVDYALGILVINILSFMLVPLSIIGFISGFMISIKRLHDMECSGYYSLLFLVPFVNLILLGFLLFYPGTDGPNKYGAYKTHDDAKKPKIIDINPS